MMILLVIVAAWYGIGLAVSLVVGRWLRGRARASTGTPWAAPERAARPDL